MMINFFASLELMWKGMAAIFVVIIAIYIIVNIMQNLGSPYCDEEN
ncbi:MAG: hypothetical protein PHY91_08070 [Tissierellia bacterium]|nr:hypothetical protein [Tissierellia bacterium]MDD4726849.1 hypothetical protein [Tissierellia bacterium]